MKAYGFTAAGEGFLEVPVPVPGPDELLVRVRAAGVNPGDWKVRDGAYGEIPSAPLGRECAGTVVGIGDDVRGFAEGDEVFGGNPGMVGGWAEFALVTASFAALRPDGVAPESVAVLPVAAGTAFDALAELDLPAGATLLVNGAGGGVGVAAVQLGVARGLRVIGTASPGKHELITRFGGVPVAYGDGVVERIREAAPDGVDAVFDLVGGEALRTVAALLADPATLRSVADKALVDELGGRAVERNRSTAVLTELARLVAEGTLDPHVTDVYPFDEARAALAEVESGHATGKVAIRISD
jgi:NADPH:quinone reductase-like Zn-dependent oxidoreductase